MRVQCCHCQKWYLYYGNPSNKLWCSAKCLKDYEAYEKIKKRDEA